MSYPDPLPPMPLWLGSAEAHPDHPAVTEWQRHVDAGRIGGNPPCPPEVAALRDAAAGYFAAVAFERRRAAAWGPRANAATAPPAEPRR